MNQITQTVLVISASTYIIKDDKTNEVENSGTTVRYIATDDLTPCENEPKTLKGYKPAKANLPIEAYKKQFTAVPALYEATLNLDVNSQGVTTVKVTDFKFMATVVLADGEAL
jgi:hypothetical protein